MNMKKKGKIEKVSKPYMKGDMFDRTSLPGVLKFLFSTVAMTIVFMMICGLTSWEQQWLNVAVNLAVVLVMYMLFAQFGMNAGTDAVNQGEIMYAREEKGRPVASWERSMCYHPFKGFLVALIGSIPLVACSIILACIAERQMSGIGALPSWVGSIQGRQEIGNALTIYHEKAGMTLELAMRVIVRMSTLPFVNMVGAEDLDAMLVLERVSPLLNLLPAIFYGVGYTKGVRIRTEVHTNIALGKKKLKRKQAKERRARRQNHSPEQLN